MEELYINSLKDEVFNSSLTIGNIILIIILLIILCILLVYIRSTNLEKRFKRFTIKSINNKSNSLLDNFIIKYNKLIHKISLIISKSEILTKKSIKYEKYKVAFKLDNDNIDFISKKIFLGIIYIIFIFFINIFNSKLISFIDILIPFILGYNTLDIIYIYKYSKYRKLVQNDLYDAISLMNNAFKSGMSIYQAVELVSKELSGPIRLEFKKINLEISYGLDIEVAFIRFAKRINLEEALYLSSSISILNKTGGNIIKVFDSIEKNIFNKKKLKQELNALSSSSRLIMYVLILVPPLFTILIYILNNDYYKPLFNNIIGITILAIIIIIYIFYIIIVRKVLNVRGIR